MASDGLIIVLPFSFGVWNARLAVKHAEALWTYDRSVSQALTALQNKEVPEYPLMLAHHLERVTKKGPKATRTVPNDLVGFLVTAVFLAGLSFWVGSIVWP